jgi:hypothetical protein
MMPPYPLVCYRQGCGHPALFKIASRWSDGITSELKTYSLGCPDCLPELLREARTKQVACRLAPGESLESPAVYELRRGVRDRELVRREDLDEGLRTKD